MTSAQMEDDPFFDLVLTPDKVTILAELDKDTAIWLLYNANHQVAVACRAHLKSAKIHFEFDGQTPIHIS